MNFETDAWRHKNIGRLLNNSVRRFEARVFEILNAAGHGDVRISLLSLTRNLDLGGTRITELARRAEMTKQSMSETVLQGEKLGLVVRIDDETDRRAKKVIFTDRGRDWLSAFHDATSIAEAELRADLGVRRATALIDALTQYGRGYDTLSGAADRSSDATLERPESLQVVGKRRAPSRGRQG